MNKLEMNIVRFESDDIMTTSCISTLEHIYLVSDRKSNASGITNGQYNNINYYFYDDGQWNYYEAGKYFLNPAAVNYTQPGWYIKVEDASGTYRYEYCEDQTQAHLSGASLKNLS